MKPVLVAYQVIRVMHANTSAYVELNETKGWLKQQKFAGVAVKYKKTYSVESETQGLVG